jgi:hypothetical protein
MTSYEPGTLLDFRVQGTVDERGVVHIGCQQFSQAAIGDVAQDLQVTPPPERLVPGMILRATTPHHRYGEFFLVANQEFGEGVTVWSLQNGTYATKVYWQEQTGGDLVPVYTPEGEYTDKNNQRYRRG